MDKKFDKKFLSRIRSCDKFKNNTKNRTIIQMFCKRFAKAQP